VTNATSWIFCGFQQAGGKTEAYLGVAAFAMILRRLRGDGTTGDGVSVIMRYTLRLLTLQQFERASTLICALEFLRRTDSKNGLGTEPFLIGLWVGWTLTPNSWQQSQEVLQSLKKNIYAETSEGSPVQNIFCPWCGHKITPRNYDINPQTKWTISHCADRKCFFYDSDLRETKHALPIVTVDTDIYRRCPSMIIATVDKFARMPYRPEIASIFGRAIKYCERDGFLSHPEDSCGVTTRHNDGKRVINIEAIDPPDLIIQDELHLITGPLGSMIGLYETAVDFLCSRQIEGRELKPKIIASSATVRGVDDQIRKLFNRHPPQKFPPPGVDKSDSFFCKITIVIF